MWAGWLSATSWLIFATLLLTIGKIDEHFESWPWYAVFLPLYPLLFAFYWCAFAPLYKYRAAGILDIQHTGKSRLEISEAKRSLKHATPTIIFSTLLTILLTLFLYFLIHRLETGTGTWTSVCITGVLFLSIITLYMIIGFGYEIHIHNKLVTDPAPTWSTWDNILACCYDIEQVTSDIPICISGYRHFYARRHGINAKWHIVFNAALVLALLGGIISFICLCSALDAWLGACCESVCVDSMLASQCSGTFLGPASLCALGSCVAAVQLVPESLTLIPGGSAYIFVPLWIGLGLLILACMYVTCVECSIDDDNNSACYNIFIMIIFIISIILIVVFTILLCFHDSHDSVFDVLWPLLIVFGLNGLVFMCVMCQQVPVHESPEHQKALDKDETSLLHTSKTVPRQSSIRTRFHVTP